eukprot:TRINITY_DN2119_c0_g1_i1.p1 TRINITY_DN2119_c0_g1~~TRINITY_DN2119_c0_g1_i1.p1  ORF type:complete len:323 (+),score=79.97 TRINITY_DN2119_c0_g1_i1:312-1280(+)
MGSLLTKKVTPQDTRQTNDNYTKLLKEHQFGSFDIQGDPKVDYYFKGQKNNKISPKFLSELETLAHSLPLSESSSIFARVDENHANVLKVLIIGPRDTPYAFGCYEFDIWIPERYPDVCPQVQFRTTGAGAVRFNPNLYNCGKVCLSLLGTWSGSGCEVWQPRTSTLLQVLVSIQSLILVHDPFYNEPSYDSGRYSQQYKGESDSYNNTIYVANVVHAIIKQLQNPPIAFEHVIKTHFALVKDQLLKEVEMWGKTRPQIAAQVQQLKQLLEPLKVQLPETVNEQEDVEKKGEQEDVEKKGDAVVEITLEKEQVEVKENEDLC